MHGTVLPFPGSDLRSAAARVLRANDTGRYTLCLRELREDASALPLAA